ncbi:hypothetical protein Tco_0703672 [Tanacetum coccineum]|uniref:Uncharacterized protein n=1 Tax=Tanacetum coccineum TaxID=301880 RepID=A0ABQ4Y104_9ASTR
MPPSPPLQPSRHHSTTVITYIASSSSSSQAISPHHHHHIDTTARPPRPLHHPCRSADAAQPPHKGVFGTAAPDVACEDDDDEAMEVMTVVLCDHGDVVARMVVIGVTVAVAGDAGNGAENSPEKERGDEGWLDIEDMLLLLIQQNLTNLIIDEWYDLNVALRMYTRRIVIQRRVEDLQLGVESYQKKLNLTKPDTYRLNLRNKTAYTSHSDPHGIVYVDQFKRKRLMRADELHKFSDGTLNDVRTTLHDIAAGIRMEYLLMRKWSKLDKKRARVMVQHIGKQLYQRRLMRNLEKFVSGGEYGKDRRLLERTI